MRLRTNIKDIWSDAIDDYAISVQDRIDKYKDDRFGKIKEFGAIGRMGIMDNAKFFKKMKQMGIGRDSDIANKLLGPTNLAVKSMFMTANSTLESINKRTAELMNNYLRDVRKEGRGLQEGERKEFELFYTNIKGEHVHDNFGIEKRNGELVYFHMDDSNPEVGPQPSYDTPHNILYGTNGNGILAKAMRNKAKEEMGIGEEIYSIYDDEGNKIVITDPREELDKNGKAEKSFEKGYNNFNIYRITKSGDKELLHKDDVLELFGQNGVDQEEVRNRRAKRGNFGGTIRTVLMVKREIDRAVQEGMDMTTSTRS